MELNKKDFKKLKLLTLFTHSIIIFGMGHGIGFMILVDFIGLKSVFENSFDLSLNIGNELEHRISLIAVLSIVGKVMIALTFFKFNFQLKSIFIILGIVFLWFTIFLMTYNLEYSGTPTLTLITSLFFLIVSILMIVSQIKKNMKINYGTTQ